MKMLNAKLLSGIVILSLSATGNIAAAESESLEVAGSARVRAEFRNNSDFNDMAKDYLDYTLMRFRLDLRMKPNDNLGIFLQPQFAKTWGEAEWVPTAAGVNTQSGTSGSLNDTPVDLHQGFFTYQALEDLDVSLGRKELSFGDQLLVGPVGWSNIGRSFDLGLVTWRGEGWVADFFSATVTDRNLSAASTGDKTFSGLWLATSFGDLVKELNVYAFNSSDSGASPSTATTAYGVRVKSPVENFDYRVEVTGEALKIGDDDLYARQMDLELGYLFEESKKIRGSVEYFVASENFDQLYPTGHKWLGYADLFSRKNIQGYRVGVAANPTDKVSLSVDYHGFSRYNENLPGYKFSGAAYGATGDSTAMASEVDFVLGYKLDGGLNLEFGAAQVEAGEYLKDNGAQDAAEFYYLQAMTNF